jgi:hypothetical protein
MKPGAVVLATGRELAAGFTNEVKSRGGYAETVGSVRRCRPIVGDVEALVRDLPEPEVAAAIEAVGGRRGPPNKAAPALRGDPGTTGRSSPRSAPATGRSGSTCSSSARRPSGACSS